MRRLLDSLLRWLAGLVPDPFPAGLGDYYDAGETTISDWSAKGGGSPKPPKQQKIELPPPPPPIKLPPPPKPQRPPPVMTDLREVDQARDDAKRKVKAQRGISKTLLAGETGGYMGGTLGGSGQGKSLLG